MAKMEDTGKTKGQAFEEKVARWVKKQFEAKVVKRNQLFKGKTAVRPFEVDIVGWRKSGVVFWVECKDRQASIKRTDIFKLWESASDVKKTTSLRIGPVLFEEKGGEEWDYLVFVSTSKFDPDAVNFAKEHNIACYCYDGKTFQEISGFRRSWL